MAQSTDDEDLNEELRMNDLKEELRTNDVKEELRMNDLKDELRKNDLRAGRRNDRRSEVEEKTNRDLVKAIGTAFFLNVIQTTATMTANSTMMLEVAGNDPSRAGTLTGKLSTIGALCEFLTGPLLGRGSDVQGRRPFVIAGAVGSAIMDFIVFLDPRSYRRLRLRTIISTVTNTSVITTVRAGLSDRMTGEELGAANAQVGIYAGLAVIVGPMLGSLAQDKFGAKFVYFMSTAVGCLNAYLLSRNLKETLRDEDKKKMDWTAINPLSFLKLLQRSKDMMMTALSLGFQCIGEARFIFPYVMLTWQTVHGYSSTARGGFAAVFGMSYILGAVIAKKRIAKIGMEAHITESNLSNLLGFFIWSLRQNIVGTVAAFAAMTFGIRKRDGLEVLLVKQGAEQGWGRGETYGYIANFKSMSAVLAPLLYSYSMKRGKNFHGAPMLSAAIMTLMAEMLFRLRN